MYKWERVGGGVFSNENVELKGVWFNRFCFSGCFVEFCMYGVSSILVFYTVDGVGTLGTGVV